MRLRIKDFIIKSLGRKMIAWYVASGALWAGKIDGWMWISATFILLGLASAEKISGATEKIQQKLLDRIG